jgi:hypothetical protein
MASVALVRLSCPFARRFVVNLGVKSTRSGGDHLQNPVVRFSSERTLGSYHITGWIGVTFGVDVIVKEKFVPNRSEKIYPD